MAPENIQLTRLEDPRLLAALKSEDALLTEGSVNTIFLTNDWLNEWWRFYGDGSQLWTLVARDQTRLIGMVPLVLQRGAAGLRRLQFMGTGEVTPNHLDLLAYPDRRADIVHALAEHLLQTVSEWDLLELDKLPAEAETAEMLRAALGARGLVAEVEVSARCSYADLPASFDDYLKGRSESVRRNYRRRKRNLEQDCPTIRYGRVETPEELNEMLDNLIRLHQARWTQRGYPGAFSNDRFIAFHRAAAQRGLSSGRLRMYYIKINAETVAVYYCYRMGNTIQCYLGSFDERWSKYGLGQLMKGYAMEQSILEGVQRIDFLEGDEKYKDDWATGVRGNLRLRAYAPHWRGGWARLRTHALAKLMEWGVRYVPVQIRRPLWQRLERWRRARAGDRSTPKIAANRLS